MQLTNEIPSIRRIENKYNHDLCELCEQVSNNLPFAKIKYVVSQVRILCSKK